jgi:hypothetical protein
MKMLTDSIQHDKDYFYALVDALHRDGIKEFCEWLETTDFFTAPASHHFHESYKGGLLEHSLRVYLELTRLASLYSDIPFSSESLIITSLFHDVCKIGFYTTSTRNTKIDGKWTTVPYYTIDEQYLFGGHGSKSVYLIQQYMRLEPNEAAAINTHMGPSGNDYSCYNTYRKYPLAMLLHTADMIATCDLMRENV